MMAWAQSGPVSTCQYGRRLTHLVGARCEKSADGTMGVTEGFWLECVRCVPAMRNMTGPPVTGEDLYGRRDDIERLWARLGRGEHLLMLAPRRVGKTSMMLELACDPGAGWDVVYTAASFLRRVGEDCGLPLADPWIGRILDLLGDPVPYHVQLFFATLQDACRASAELSEPLIERCFEERLTGLGGTPHPDHYAGTLGGRLRPSPAR